MTPETVQQAVADIAAVSGDDEIAHIREDDMYRDLLEAIAAGVCDDPQECARIALTSSDLDFPRWHA